LVVVRRHIATESLVWPVAVVLLAEAVEGALLRLEIRRRRRRGLLRKSEVHPLMSAILLRLAGLDPLVSNSELPPPGRKLRQAGDAARRERGAVVASDGVRQAELVEDLLHDLPDPLAVGPAQRDARDEKAAVGVGDGERVAARRPDREVALEVDAPDLVRCLGVGERRREGRRLALAPLRADETVAPEDERERAHRRQLGPGIGAPERVAQLARSPLRLLPTGSHDGVLDPRGYRLGTAMRPAGPVTELAVVHEAPDPLVAGLPADAVPAAQLCDRELAGQIVVDESLSLGHG